VTAAGAEPSGSWRRLRRRVYELLDPTIDTFWDKVVHNGLITLVLLNVIAVVLESVPSIEDRFRTAFTAFEILSVAVFTAEYALRLWTAVEHMPLAGHSPSAARWAWAGTPSAIVDLLAVIPFYIAVLDVVDLRVLALLRLVRFFKLARYSSGLTSLLEAIYSERHALVATLLILSGLVLTMASFMYLAERDAQPDRFGTIPDAMWWAIVTLTTVGYGDVVPITPLGKVIGGLAAIMGVAMLALPVGIVATAFSDVIHRRQFVVTWSMVAKVPIFRSLEATAIAEIMQLLHSRTAQKGDVVARRGEQADALYFIVRGEVEVELMDADNVYLRDGDFFGEIAILTGDVRNATVRAARDTQLLVLQAHDLERLMDRVPEIGKRIRDVGHARAPHRVEAHPSDQGRTRKPAREPPAKPGA
jgi:voltage-gated potassium channel